MSGWLETSWYKSLVVLESTKSQAQRIKEPMTSFVRGKIKKLGRNDSQSIERDRDSGPEDHAGRSTTPTEEFGDVRLRSGSSASPSLGSQRRRPDPHPASTIDGLWDDGEKAIYEQQLEQLQEQLMAVMIEKDRLAERVKTLEERDANRLLLQLEEERRRSAQLTEELREIQTSLPSSRASSALGVQLTVDEGDVEWVSVRHREGGTRPGLRQRSAIHTGESEGADSKSSLTSQESTADASQARKLGFFHRLHASATKAFWNVLSDFTLEGEDDSVHIETSGDPVSYKKLRKNWGRFWEDLQPLVEFIKTVNGIINWKQWSLSLACFLMYMYAVWRGVLIPLALLLCLAWLAHSYLKTSGILAQFSVTQTDNTNTTQNDSATQRSARAYLELITQVAQLVQNKSGDIADSLEKVYNLLSWHHPAGAKKIFVMLFCAFLISILLPEATTFRLFGLVIGYKLFIERSIYRRFPKVKRKYDSMSKLWEELPTNAELETLGDAQDAIRAQRDHSAPGASEQAVDFYSMTAVCSSDHSFCERFGLELEDRPLDGWKTGRRCVLIDRDRPLSNIMTPGKLFLTQHYICFERLSKSKDGSNDDRFTIMLSEIRSIKKAKPFARLPGSGMALELHIQHNEKPVVLGAILNRHEVYSEFVAAGQRAQLAWALKTEQN